MKLWKFGPPLWESNMEEWRKVKKNGTKGTNSIFDTSHDEIDNIPADWLVTYAHIVVNLRPHKEYQDTVWMTTGENIIKYHGKFTTKTADLTTSKVLWNILLSKKDAKCMGLDIVKFI